MVSARHPSDESLWESARTGDARDIGRHASRCDRCADELRLAGLVIATCAVPSGACLEEIDLVLVADGMMRDAASLRHVESCPECARQVEALQVAGSVVAAQSPVARAVSAASDAIARALSRLASTQMPVALQVTTRGGATAKDESIERGMRAYRRHRWDEAAGHFDAAFRAGSESADSALLLGACLRRAGKPAEAADVFRRASQSRPTASEPRWQLVQALLECGDAASALAELEKLARKPGPRREIARELSRRVRSATEGA